MKAAAVPLLTDPEDFNEDKTPNFIRGNKFFGIPLSDSAQSSPRWSTRLMKKSPLEKTDDAEGNVSNEAYSESILQHLNRQVRLDRKSLMALYMELDEERSAAAVAANNAMAMITRLQAEKAAVQMDALQYQRMMEEQAEYDQEALQTTKDLLSKREEEIKDLEVEVEAYREKYGILRDEEIEGRVGETGDHYQEYKSKCCSSKNETEGQVGETDDDYQEYKSKCSSSNNEKPECSSPPDGEGVKINDQARSLQDENGGTTDDKLLQTKQMNNLKIADKKVHFSLDDGIPSTQSSEKC